LPVAIFLALAFVMLLFTLSEFNAGLDQMPFPVERRANTGLAFLRDPGIDLCEFFFVQ